MPVTTGTDLYKQIAAQAANRFGVPADLFLAQINQESHWNPKIVSPAGAKGIAQLMPGHPDSRIVAQYPEFAGLNPYDARGSLNYAAAYMKFLFDKYGRWDSALAAYNAGEPTVDAYLTGRTIKTSRKVINPNGYKTDGGIPPYRETRNYVDTIIKQAASIIAPPAPPAQPAPVNVVTSHAQAGSPQLRPASAETYRVKNPQARKLIFYVVLVVLLMAAFSKL